LLSTSLERVENRLLRHPWVKSVSITRRLPHTLAIEVCEREEVAWMADPSGEGCLALGEGGVIVADGCSSSTSTIELRGARLSGFDPGSVLLDDTISDLIDAARNGVIASLDARLIDLTDPASIELVSESGLRILLGKTEEVLSRLDSLAALCRTLDMADYEVIDLRFGGEATLVPR